MEPRTFPLTQRLRLEIRIPAGSIEVSADDVRTSADLRIDGDREGDIRVSFGPAVDGERLRVEHRSGRFGLGRHRHVDVEIGVPTGTIVEVESGSADLTARGAVGDVTFRSGSGDLTLERVAGDVSANTASGDMFLGSVTGSVAAHGASGDVKADDVGGSFVVRSVSGDVVAGSIGGRATIATVSGDVRIGRLGPDRTSLRAVSGDIEAGVPRGAAVYLDLSSTSGDVETELDDAAPPAEGADMELVASSVSGDIRVRRAPAA